MGCSGEGRECQRSTTGRTEKEQANAEMWSNLLQLIRKCIPVYLFCSFPAHKIRAVCGREEVGKAVQDPLSSLRRSSEEAKASEVKTVRLQSPHIKHAPHISFPHTEISLLRTLNSTWHLPLHSHTLTHKHTLAECNQAGVSGSLGEAGSVGLRQAAGAFSWAWTRCLDTAEHTAVSQNLDSD